LGCTGQSAKKGERSCYAELEEEPTVEICGKLVLEELKFGNVCGETVGLRIYIELGVPKVIPTTDKSNYNDIHLLMDGMHMKGRTPRIVFYLLLGI
jgi:hypothetical protein